MSWMSSTTVVFPLMALFVALTTVPVVPTVLTVVLLIVGLLPWALVAGGVRLPSMVLVIVDLAVVSVLTIRYENQGALFLGVVACMWIAAQGLRSQSIVAVIGFSAVSIGCSVSMHDDKQGWVIWLTGMLFGWFVGSLMFRQQRLTADLDAARSDLAATVAEQERKAIAREVHDIVGHSLTVVLLNIAGARRHLATNPAAAAEAMERAEKISRDSLESVRSVVGLLSSSSDSQRDAPLPSGADVAPMLEQARRSGLPITVEVTGEPAELDPTIGLTVVRLLQESLANASRHAPGTTIDVRVEINTRSVTTTIANDLVTRAAATPTAPTSTAPTSTRTGLGVAGMTDRIEALNGSLDIGVRDGRWVVRGVLPRRLSRAPELAVR